MINPRLLALRARVAGLFLAIVWLGGCQQLARQDAIPYPAAELEQRLGRLQHWQAEGKLAVKTPTESQSASFTWRQAEDAYDIHIFGPFGQGSTHLRRKRGEVSIENSDIGKRRAASAELLMQELLGWSAPVSALQYWSKGVPSPQTPARLRRDTAGLIAAIEQNGWTVEYTQFEQVGRWRLPAKFIAQRQGLRLRVVIKHWKL